MQILQQITCLFKDGHHVAALSLCEKACSENPNSIELALLAGKLHYLLLDFERAIPHLNRALKISSGDQDALFNLATCLRMARRFREAFALFDAYAKKFPCDVGGWINLAEVQGQIGQYREALISIEKAIELDRSIPEVFLNKGAIENSIRLHDRALLSCNEAIRLNPDFVEGWSNRGNTLNFLKRHQEALESCDQAIRLQPDHAGAWNSRGNALDNLARHEDALASYNRAIEAKPDFTEAWSNRAKTLNYLGRYHEALDSCDRAIKLKHDHAVAWNIRGNALDDLADHEEALASYNFAIEFSPGYAEAYWNKSLLLLRLGKFPEGWRLYEWRWRCPEFPSSKRDFEVPLWLGDQSIAGKTILLHAEQGLGDTLQFCRYSEMVANLGAKVILEVQAPLVDLLMSLRKVSQVIVAGQALPFFDFHCPLMTLPLALKTKVDSIPKNVPYLKPSDVKVKSWGARLSRGRKPKIGIVWSSFSGYKYDHLRSLSFKAFSRCLPEDRFEIFCLQKKIGEQDLEALSHRRDVTVFASELTDFSETAALASHMDLVISTCTSVPHLTGATGVPTWVLLSFRPDFRWMLESEDSPWYPGMRLFRQPSPNDWDAVFSSVSEELLLRFGPVH